MMMMVVLQLLGILEHAWTLTRDDVDGAPVTRHFGTCLDDDDDDDDDDGDGTAIRQFETCVETCS